MQNSIKIDDNTIQSEVHPKLLSLLKQFDKICTDNQIKYSLHGGTLLGAVREKGFIQWDDDADIAMTCEEYKKLVAVMNNSTLQMQITEYPAVQIFDPVIKEGWIDIFIYSNITSVPFFRKIKLLCLDICSAMLRTRETINLSEFKKYSKKKVICYKIIYYVGKIFPMKFKRQLYRFVADHLSTGKKNLIHRANDNYVGRRIAIPVTWMEKYERIKFEDTSLMTSSSYHNILVSSYGQDYMIPIQPTEHAIHVHRTENNLLSKKIIS